MPKFELTVYGQEAIQTITHIAKIEVEAADEKDALLKAQQLHEQGQVDWKPISNTAVMLLS
jgi:hypothetical protein